jgi:GH24 family phage-related lysozyme (muramidase)
MALEVEINPLNTMLSEVVDSLAKYEGVKGGGKRIEDPSKIKAPYGTDNPPVPRLDNEQDRDYAKRIAGYFHNNLINKFGESYIKAPISVQKALIDFQYNTGGFAGTEKTPNLNRALENNDYSTVMKNTLDVISAYDSKKGSEGVLLGIAKRRAIEYNNTADDLGIPKLNLVKLETTPQGTARIIYKNKDNVDVLNYSFSNKGVHSQSSTGSFSPIEESLKLMQ